MFPPFLSPRQDSPPSGEGTPARKLPAEVLEEAQPADCGAASAPVIDAWSAFSVGAGGALGSLGRYLLAGWIDWRWGGLPLGILLVNVSGSFAIGGIDALTGPRGARPAGAPARRFLMAGVCGGYTTYSSFALLTLDLARAGAWPAAAANVVLSFALCLAATAAGQAAGNALGRGGRKR